ncbi:MAG: amidohydrolase family protein [Planctomycetota bacterium]|jgi:predicted TIM-barrel fold metal-dependent hydrolase
MIDTHLHLWDPATIRRSWLAGVPELDRPFLLGDYQSMASTLGITAAVHVESDVNEAELDREMGEVAAVMDVSPLVRASVVGGRPGEPGFKAWLDHLGRCPGVVGLRRVFHGLDGVPGVFLTAGLVDDLVLLGERGLHFELCVRPDQLDAATALVDACPGTRFVLDHLGRPEVTSGVTPVWAEGLRRIAERGNVVAKLSGLIECSSGAEWTTETFRPFLDLAFERFGADRLVWGSNWPVCELGGSLERWVTATRSLLADQPEAVQAAVLEGNAKRIYRLG